MWYPNIILFQAPNPSLIEPSFHENLTWFQKSESEFRILEATTTTNKHQQMERKITSRPFVIERNNLRKKHHYSHIENYGWVSCMYVCGPCHRNPTSSRRCCCCDTLCKNVRVEYHQ